MLSGKSHGAYQRRGSRTRSAVIMMMKMVEPYIIIMSPAEHANGRASAAASIVPTITGVPTASPVSLGLPFVTPPMMSVVQARSGRLSTSMISGQSAPPQFNSSTR